jgi:dihydroorotase
VEPGIITYAQLVEKMACAPARIFKLPGGTLRRGAAGDVTVFDPTREWKVDAKAFRSKGRNTPYQGRTLRGKAVCTVVGGRVVYREGAD